jgi:hypothetical protein
MDNPLRSEAAMFRLVVLVGLAAVPVVALGLLAGATWALVAIVLELAAAVFLVRRGRGRSQPPPPTCSSR